MTLLSSEADTRAGAPGRVLTLALLAGRGAFRATAQLAPLALATTWGPAGFADYAGAAGVSAWIVFVAASGEKAALKLMPRARRLRPRVAALVLRVAAVPVAVAAAAAVVVVAADVRTLVAAALLWSAALGLLQLTVGLHRVSGRPAADVWTYGAMTIAVAGLSAATWLLHWPPLRQLQLLAAAALTASALLLWLLPAGWSPPGRAGHRIGRIVLRTCVLLGLPELLAGAAVAVCYLALNLAGQARGSGAFYVAVTGSGFCSAAIVYLLRLSQPATSLRLRGTAGRAGRVKARRVLRLGTALCVAGLPAWLLLPPGNALLAVLTCLETPLFALVAYAGYLVENTDGRSPRLTAAAAAAGLPAAGVTAALLVPSAGASGAMAALLLSAGAVAATLDLGLRRAARPRPSETGPMSTTRPRRAP